MCRCGLERADREHADSGEAKAMKRQWAKVALVIIGALAVGVVLAKCVPWDQPKYRGKPLSFWLDQIDSQEPAQAQVAVQAIGPRANPFLFEEVRRRASLWKRYQHDTNLVARAALELRQASNASACRAFVGSGPDLTGPERGIDARGS